MEGALPDVDELRRQIMRKFNDGGDRGLYDRVMAFVSAVDWSEPLLRVIVGIHVTIFLLALVSTIRGWFKVQIGVLCSIMGLTYISGGLNWYGIKHWEDFATQRYFDESGFFVALVWAGPLLLMGFALVTLMTINAGRLLIQVKRQELKASVAARRNQDAAANADAAVNADDSAAPPDASEILQAKEPTADGQNPQETARKRPKRKATRE